MDQVRFDILQAIAEKFLELSDQLESLRNRKDKVLDRERIVGKLTQLEEVREWISNNVK